MPALVERAYVARTLTLPSANVAYRLYDLLVALDSTMSGLCCQLNIQNHHGSALVKIGDSSLTTSNYAYQMGPLTAAGYGAFGMSSIPFIELYAMSDTNSTDIGVELLN